MSTFCQRPYHRKSQRRWVGGQKKAKVNVVCEQPPILRNHGMLCSSYLRTFDHFYQLDLNADCGRRPVF